MDVSSTGVAAAWTGADMSTRLLPEVVPGIDADKASFYESRGGGGRSRLEVDSGVFKIFGEWGSEASCH